MEKEIKNIYLKINDKTFKLPVSSETLKLFKKANSFITELGDGILIENSFFCKSHEVPPVYRYGLENVNGRFRLTKNNSSTKKYSKSKYIDRAIDDDNETSSVVIVLESPHADEYTYQNNTLSRIAPAQGRTGDFIEKKFVELLERNNVKIKTKKSRVIIINPIPIQASAHFLHNQPIKGDFKNLRDFIWKTLWQEEYIYKERFLSTLDVLSPFVVFNCCTRFLSEYITSTLSKTNLNCYKSTHPSSWRYSKNLTAIKLIQ